MLEAVIEQAVRALEAAGIAAAPAYQKAAAPEAGAFVCVGVKRVSARDGAYGRYLGIAEDGERGAREVYGLRCEAEMSLDIYTPYAEENAASAAAALFDRAAVVLGGMAGVSLRAVHCGESAPERETGFFHLRGGAECELWLTTEADEAEAMEFTDFVLRGELKNEFERTT